MLAIRFNRTGKRNHASFRVVLQEHTKAPGKRHVEILGSYDPHKKTAVLKKDRILYWIGQGAQTSPVVTNLLIREGVIEGKKIAKKISLPVVQAPEVAAQPEAASDQEAKIGEIPMVEEVKAETAVVRSEAVSASAEAVAEAPAETAPVAAEAPKA